ncbi:eukaryotic translation initiation factor 3 subunit D [Desarmillaria tabescens]|uniref:Eukaryotic translation initiation factor 3 subunit D n=1 Tax=Armillaria tabescens TaxID=1929756 RepID=A0AA39T3F4_ARMTA|nr:eukaryotic translation initiation factor 3 subunit D [Desarmillaria tabescens]KAK0461696.1 eukaryotic translation initiation factor 3 subunit D [Desarmillaria tabescens]
MSTPKFTLPPIHDTPDSPWGPPPLSSLPSSLTDVPYAPYSKSDKLGRFADWNALPVQSQAQAQTQTKRAGGGGGGTQAYGSGTASAFAYFHAEDEASFSLVDNTAGKSAVVGRGRGGARGGGGRGGRGGSGRGGGAGGTQQGGRGGAQGGRGGGRRNWRDWEKSNRARESSVVISPSWDLKEEIEFHRLAKLRLDVDEPEDIDSYGRLYEYDKSYDRITTKSERPLQILDRLKYNPTTSDDPVIQSLHAKQPPGTVRIYTTDTILSVLMCATRSVYPWDIVILRTKNALFLDKRDGGPFDTVTVNENATDPPSAEGPSINTPLNLSLEATFINQNFGFQSVDERRHVDLGHPNPFHPPEEREPLASCGYRYREFDLGISEDEDVKIVVRTEVDAVLPGTGGTGYATIRALNEYEPKACGAPDWRTKLDSQRGAVVATEMKNNSAKLARWAVQALLAGSDTLKVGYVSRVSARDNTRHVVLSTASMRPGEFAGQLNVGVSNGWGVVRCVADVCLGLGEGKFVLVRDPNKPVVRLYAVPMGTFVDEEEEGGEAEGGGAAEEV